MDELTLSTASLLARLAPLIAERTSQMTHCLTTGQPVDKVDESLSWLLLLRDACGYFDPDEIAITHTYLTLFAHV